MAAAAGGGLVATFPPDQSVFAFHLAKTIGAVPSTSTPALLMGAVAVVVSENVGDPAVGVAVGSIVIAPPHSGVDAP